MGTTYGSGKSCRKLGKKAELQKERNMECSSFLHFLVDSTRNKKRHNFEGMEKHVRPPWGRDKVYVNSTLPEPHLWNFTSILSLEKHIRRAKRSFFFHLYFWCKNNSRTKVLMYLQLHVSWDHLSSILIEHLHIHPRKIIYINPTYAVKALKS